MSSDAVQPAGGTSSQTSTDNASNTLSGTESVHFDLPFDDDAAEHEQRTESRPRRKRQQEPRFTPRAVFGLYLPDELVIEIGWTYTPHWKDKDRNNLTSGELAFLDDEGILCASAYCKDKFPDIPLRWSHTVLAYAGDPMGLQPILVLGHMDSKKVITVDVTNEEMERMRDELGLGDQEPEWYRIVFVR